MHTSTKKTAASTKKTAASTKTTKKRVPHMIRARIDTLGFALKAALDNMMELRAGLKLSRDLRDLPPSLFDACMVWATLTSEGLNRVSVGDLRRALDAHQRDSLVVDLRLLTVADGAKGIF